MLGVFLRMDENTPILSSLMSVGVINLKPDIATNKLKAKAAIEVANEY